MTDEELKALADTLDALLYTGADLLDAASAIRQLMRERDEARDKIDDLERALAFSS